ncbi:MAG: hypothetical protein ACOZE5_18720 [Verrucomicrobiota bacterium]
MASEHFNFRHLSAAKYGKGVACLAKGRAAQLAFYDFPAEHWRHICAPPA